MDDLVRNSYCDFSRTQKQDVNWTPGRLLNALIAIFTYLLCTGKQQFVLRPIQFFFLKNLE